MVRFWTWLYFCHVSPVDWETVKRSGRNELIRVVIHLCMEAMLGISLYSYPYLILANIIFLSYYSLCLLFNKIGEEGSTGSSWKQGGVGIGSVGEEMSAQMNK
jgi:hypothetical protein